MNGYIPLKITGNETGLVQEREQFLLPNDAYPTLNNAYVWRERIKRKQGCQTIGRLQRNFIGAALGNSSPSVWSFNLFSTLVSPITGEPNSSIVPGSIVIDITNLGTLFIDNGLGVLTNSTPGNSGTINYATGNITITFTVASGSATFITFGYYPGLPVMGLRLRDQNLDITYQTIAFDTKYAYNFNGTVWQEFLPGTTWTGTDYEFFWSTNYWIANLNNKVFWVTNYSASGDPIRYTTGVPSTNWVDFTPQINVSGDLLLQALCILPFRGRLVVFNTKEQNAGVAGFYTNRIRWAAIGTPFTTVSPIVGITGVNPNAWRDDVRGQGNFLNIPTNEDIVSVGFVRDNLIIYCERSTWQLRYTGRTIAPFQIERVNSELGVEGTFSSIQFDTSLVGIGDKGIVECDSYQSNLIDIKIPDFVYNLQNENNGPARVHGIRDFINRLAYWTVPSTLGGQLSPKFPNQRLIYNYENDSWATFDDSFTTLGTIQVGGSRTWVNTHLPWIQCNFPWTNQVTDDPLIIGGNQQGFVMYLDEQTTNDPTLFIQNITANTTTATVITSPAHNLRTGMIIKISDIPIGTPFDNLNGNIFYVVVNNVDTFQLWKYNTADGQFSLDQLDTATGFVGIGNISIRDNFNIVSKKFNFLDEGQNIKIGFLDILMSATEPDNSGAISLNIYVDYNDDEAINTDPQNVVDIGTTTFLPDGFFNQIIPTTSSDLNNKGGSKFWQRVYCPSRGNFLTIEYTFSNAQMAGIESTLDVQIDAQVLWLRKGGRMTQI